MKKMVIFSLLLFVTNSFINAATVDISGLPKDKLAVVLFKRAKIIRMGKIAYLFRFLKIKVEKGELTQEQKKTIENKIRENMQIIASDDFEWFCLGDEDLKYCLSLLNQDLPLKDEDIEFMTTKYMDYVHGKLMKIDISGDKVNTFLYNRDNGKNAAEDVIEQVRRDHEKQKQDKPHSKVIQENINVESAG